MAAASPVQDSAVQDSATALAATSPVPDLAVSLRAVSEAPPWRSILATSQAPPLWSAGTGRQSGLEFIFTTEGIIGWVTTTLAPATAMIPASTTLISANLTRTAVRNSLPRGHRGWAGSSGKSSDPNSLACRIPRLTPGHLVWRCPSSRSRQTHVARSVKSTWAPGRDFPARCPESAALIRVLLGPHPWLKRAPRPVARPRSSASRRLRRGLLSPTHHRLRLVAFPMRTAQLMRGQGRRSPGFRSRSLSAHARVFDHAGPDMRSR